MNRAESTSSAEASELLGFAQELKIDYSRSSVFPLFTREELERLVKELKQVFKQDEGPAGQTSLNAWNARSDAAALGKLLWFQRIQLGDFAVTTTSDHSLYSGENPGPLNTLWGYLTPIEGTVLRPLPKWAYLRKVLPPVRGKTVLEIGTACGFWPLQFARLGARFSSGIEVVPELVDQAKKAAAVNASHGDVHIVLGDAYLDPSVPRHDVVFMSEVLIHSIFPDFSLLRALNLAKEWLVIDDFFGRDENSPATLRLMRDQRSGKITWTGFAMTEKLFFQFLYAYGIDPARVTRYHDPFGEHTVFVIDTRGLRDFRRGVIGHDSLFSSLQARMTCTSFADSLRESDKLERAPRLTDN